MSRVSYAMLHDRGAAEMTAAVRTRFATSSAASPRRPASTATRSSSSRSWATRSCTTSCSASTRSPLGPAPFTLATDAAVHTSARELELGVHPGARVYVLPCIAGHVGADTAGRDPGRDAAPGRRRSRSSWTWAPTPSSCSATGTGCSPRRAPPGPAFEGAQISAGQRAAPGAIERVRIDPATLEPRFRVIGSAAGPTSPGSRRHRADRHHRASAARGSSRCIAELFLAGVITADGIDRRAARRPHARGSSRTGARSATSSRAAPADRDGEPRAADHRHPERRPRHPARQGRALRRRAAADGPLGVETRRRGPARRRVRQPDRPALRDGARPGARLRPRHAPPAGNAAGTGALIALLSGAARHEIERVVRTVEKSRPRSSRASRSTSSTRWRSRTRTAPSPNLGSRGGAAGTRPAGRAARAGRRANRAATRADRAAAVAGPRRTDR